jgi:hypothetical protein
MPLHVVMMPFGGVAAMPDEKRPAAGDHDLDAALSAWEQGAGDTPGPAPHPALARLKAQFAAHPDVCALTRVTETAQNVAGDPVHVTVEGAPRLLALLEHIESLDAAASARAPAPVERVLNLVVNNYLENLLHRLTADPTSHPHYARLWNSLCAAAGAPELAVPETSAPPEASAEGPF